MCLLLLGTPILEYVFFDRRPQGRFIDYLGEQVVEPEAGPKDEAFAMEGLEEWIEAFYGRMMEWSRAPCAQRRHQ